MSKFRKKPVVIEAIECSEVKRNIHNKPTSLPLWIVDAYHELTLIMTPDGVAIKTLEGDMLASADDWIIRGVNGELYPCKPDIFEKTYESVELPTLAAVKIFDVAEEVAAPTSGLSITYTRVCDNCGDDSGEAMPLHGEYGNGKHYNYLCVDCFNSLGLTSLILLV